MAKAGGRAGKRAIAASRDRTRPRKSASPKAPKTGSRKPKPQTKATSRKRKASPASETRWLREQLKAVRLQQEATAEILQVIANSPGELGPVFRTVLENATRICDARFGTLLRFDGTAFHFAADVGTPKALAEYVRRPGPFRGPAGGMIDRILKTRQVQNTPDYAAEATPGLAAKLGGARSTLGVPILKGDLLVGAVVIYRQEIRPFSDREIDLVRSFAAQAAIAIENARLFNETRQALERQTATSEILRVISQSPTDVKPVFEAIAQTAVRLLGCDRSFIQRCDDKNFWSVAWCGPDGQLPMLNTSPVPIDPAANFPSRAIVEKKTLHLPDWSAIELPPFERAIHEKVGISSALFLPLLRDGECIGLLVMAGKRANAFDAKDIVLAEAFRDQALIAIENTRLFDEVQAKTHDLEEALQQQTATADVLKVISRSVFDLQTVLDTLVESAYQLCNASLGLLYLKAGEAFECQAIAGSGVEEASAHFKGRPIRAGRATAAERVILTGEVQSVTDFFADPEFDPVAREMIRKAGASGLGLLRSTLAVPMMRNGAVIGVLVIASRHTGEFPQRQIDLLQTFADQAVIAIENARLFDETQEALAQQRASANVLSAISNSVADTQPVFDEILRSIAHLFDSDERAILLTGEDELLHIGAMHGPNEEQTRALFPVPVKGSATEVAMRERRLVQYADVFNDPEVPPGLRDYARRLGKNYSSVNIPLLWEDQAIGSIMVGRTSMATFSDKECTLLRTFANQAVIAIQNARLFSETREALERQTATAEVLQVIGSSIGDATPVFERILESAGRLIASLEGAIFFVGENDVLHCAAARGPSADTVKANYPRPVAETAASVVIAARRQVCFASILNDPGVPDSLRRLAVSLSDVSIAMTPLLWQSGAIGMLNVTREAGLAFNEKELSLLRTFADQAVIAIQNARLFNETREALERQTATADILKVIASSPSDVTPVFEAIANRSKELVRGFSTAVFSFQGDAVHLSAFTRMNPEADAFLQSGFPSPLSDFHGSERILNGQIIRIPDTEDSSERLRTLGRLRGFRSMLFVPLLRDGMAAGLISVTRPEPGPFADHHVQLLQTFADQAVIAIENVRLFDEVQARTRELSKSLDDLRSAQDRLVQTEKLASLGQLTAGIAHEIKNPLNFVNNFSELSAELVDELDDTLAPAPLDQKLRDDVGELTQMLKSNLEKVVQHGKRADSIVKNMLLHSREGSGEHRSADINAIVEESLNLAYHGARAEKSGFAITLRPDFAADAGTVELYPQEITRALLNLISNGFYAATRRKVESGDDGFEPVLSASTRNLGKTIEIRIRDNGTGIPPEVREKMFNPFFTTKPTGEGTGLGLSMTHDIIVKQHGGRIDVETEPGAFTEFIITLPRNNGAGAV